MVSPTSVTNSIVNLLAESFGARPTVPASSHSPSTFETLDRTVIPVGAAVVWDPKDTSFLSVATLKDLLHPLFCARNLKLSRQFGPCRYVPVVD